MAITVILKSAAFISFRYRFFLVNIVSFFVNQIH